LSCTRRACTGAVDVRAGGTPVFTNLSNPNEAKADVDAGTVKADVVPAGSATVAIGPAEVNLAEGTSTIVYAYGSAEGDTLALAVQAISGLHSAPGGVPSGGGGLADESGLGLWWLVVAGGGWRRAGASRWHLPICYPAALIFMRSMPVLGHIILLALAVAACSQPPPAVVGTPLAPSTSKTSPSVAPSATVAVVPPIELRVPALKLEAKVNPVGVDAKGDFQVPPSVDKIGWYRWGPGANATNGSIVIAGHVDSAAEGKGAFFRLRDLKPGDRMTLTGADGQAREFAMVSREQYEKTKIPLEKYFVRDGELRLTLITCGGPFDRKAKHYRDNIVVTAVLTS
jgi:hypothetical protein